MAESWWGTPHNQLAAGFFPVMVVLAARKPSEPLRHAATTPSSSIAGAAPAIIRTYRPRLPAWWSSRQPPRCLASAR